MNANRGAVSPGLILVLAGAVAALGCLACAFLAPFTLKIEASSKSQVRIDGTPRGNTDDKGHWQRSVSPGVHDVSAGATKRKVYFPPFSLNRKLEVKLSDEGSAQVLAIAPSAELPADWVSNPSPAYAAPEVPLAVWYKQRGPYLRMVIRSPLAVSVLFGINKNSLDQTAGLSYSVSSDGKTCVQRPRIDEGSAADCGSVGSNASAAVDFQSNQREYTWQIPVRELGVANGRVRVAFQCFDETTQKSNYCPAPNPSQIYELQVSADAIGTDQVAPAKHDEPRRPLPVTPPSGSEPPRVDWAQTGCAAISKLWQPEDHHLSTCDGLTPAGCSHIKQCLGVNGSDVGPGLR